MSEYLKVKAEVDDYIEFYNTKKALYKLESTTAELEEEKALTELCKTIEGLSLTKDTCRIEAANSWGDIIYVYFEGNIASTSATVSGLFIRKEAKTYKDSLEQALRLAAGKARGAVVADVKRRFDKYIDIIMADVTDDVINKIGELSARIEDAQVEGVKAVTSLYDVKSEGKRMLNRLACKWFDEVELTKGMTITVVNRHNGKREDRVIKSITYPNKVKTLRFEGTSSAITDMQRVVTSRTFLLNNEQYLDFAKEISWTDEDEW